MIPFWILVVSVVAGCFGAILGLGGAVILTPFLTLGFGINIRYAVGASIISVIATSSGAAASYVKDRITNIRLAIFLEMATTLGALVGVTLSTLINPKLLYFIFAFVLLQSAFLMWRRTTQVDEFQDDPAQIPHGLAMKLNLNSQYPEVSLGKEVKYQVSRIPLGFFYMLVAGVLSGLLGIGSGVLKVLAMDSVMGLPIKVSSATSNFMIGVTAAASACVYFLKGDIIPELAAPVALGVLLGAWIGSKLLVVIPATKIRKLFVVVLVIVAIQMGLKGLGNA